MAYNTMYDLASCDQGQWVPIFFTLKTAHVAKFQPWGFNEMVFFLIFSMCNFYMYVSCKRHDALI